MIKSVLRFVLLTSFWICVPVALSQEPLDFDALKSLVEKFDLRSPEQLMRQLSLDPRGEELLSNFTLHPFPQGGQKGTPRHPRAIMFSKNLVMTVTGDPAQVGADSAEIIQVGADHEFEFRRITFPSQKNGLRAPVFSEKNPKECMACHAGRPNWGNYRKWGNIYGFADDAITKTKSVVSSNPYGKVLQTGDLAEYKNFQRYQKETAHTGLYQYLRPPKGSPVSPYAVTKEFSDYRFRPNLRLGESLNEMNLDRIFNRLKKSENYELFRSAYLLAGDDEKLSKLSKKDRQALQPLLQYAHNQQSTWDRLLSILKSFGIDSHDISLAFIPQYEKRQGKNGLNFYADRSHNYDDGSGQRFTDKLYMQVDKDFTAEHAGISYAKAFRQALLKGSCSRLFESLR